MIVSSRQGLRDKPLSEYTTNGRPKNAPDDSYTTARSAMAFNPPVHVGTRSQKGQGRASGWPLRLSILHAAD